MSKERKARKKGRIEFLTEAEGLKLLKKIEKQGRGVGLKHGY